ncbi:hypothetical protein AAY473_040525 [Plecturocebus cupreus]
MISVHYNPKPLPGSSDSPASASRVAGTTGMCHHRQGFTMLARMVLPGYLDLVTTHLGLPSAEITAAPCKLHAWIKRFSCLSLLSSWDYGHVSHDQLILFVLLVETGIVYEKLFGFQAVLLTCRGQGWDGVSLLSPRLERSGGILAHCNLHLPIQARDLPYLSVFLNRLEFQAYGKLECSGTILAHCNFTFQVQAILLSQTSQVAGITGALHHSQLIFVVLVALFGCNAMQGHKFRSHAPVHSGATGAMWKPAATKSHFSPGQVQWHDYGYCSLNLHGLSKMLPAPTIPECLLSARCWLHNDEKSQCLAGSWIPPWQC